MLDTLTAKQGRWCCGGRHGGQRACAVAAKGESRLRSLMTRLGDRRRASWQSACTSQALGRRSARWNSCPVSMSSKATGSRKRPCDVQALPAFELDLNRLVAHGQLLIASATL